MKKIITIIFMIFALLMNIYLIFYWKPNDTKLVNIKNNDSVEAVSYSKSIYKVNKNIIMDVISDEDKKQLNIIMDKLSTSDMGKIEEAFNLDDENKGIIQAFKIFKTRLSIQDYLDLRNIFSKIIDINYLDSYLNK
ncbi:hypothetical protein [Clostridium taeniosporum]|uniref:Uncharacterized protein n=1 Tax=Clostridium taeniosporum TaxID=394958 RepID=A0A1D7XH03_9CLOT|nr:hypothetical protein [Clostridium taeniosporum]AOR22616.1 hypothetical protein BGI42_02305 [Clostridium taeniosporum]